MSGKKKRPARRRPAPMPGLQLHFRPKPASEPRRTATNENANLGPVPLADRRSAPSFFAHLSHTYRRGKKIIIGLLTIGVLTGGSAYAYVLSTNSERLPALQATMSRWSGVAVRDADQCFLGIIPGAREGIDFRTGANEPADEKTLPLVRVPQGFWDVAVALENRSIGRWRTLPGLGADPLSMGQALYDTAMGRPRGASTLPQLVAGALLKTDHGSRRNWIERKHNEITNGSALYANYSLSPDEPRNLRQLVASYLPLAQSTASGRGGAIYGVAATGLVLFGKEPDALSLGEQALLAAAIKTPILLAPRGDKAGQRLAQDIFERVRHRAVYGLAQAYGHTPPVRAAIAEIRGLALPEPRLCPQLRAYLPQDAADAFRVSFNPVWRAQYFAGEELSQIVSELRAVAGPNFHDAVATVHLSLKERDNLPFKRALRGDLAALDHKIGAQLSVGLVTGTATRPIGDILLAASDHKGGIRLFYQSPERPLLDVRRATGSVSKTVAALSLAQTGSPDDIYCNLRIDGVFHNANGDRGKHGCWEPGGAISARESFRRSLNLPIYYALRSDSNERLGKILGATGFIPYQDLQLPLAVAFGMVYASPGDMMRMMTALTRGLDGAAPVASSPHILAGIDWRRTDQATVPLAAAIDLSPYLSNPVTEQFIGSVLGAPLEQGGTAFGLMSCHERMGWRLAKTGTVAVSGHVASKLLLASGSLRGEPISVLGVIGTVADQGNINPVTTGALAQLICKSVEPKDSES